MYTCEKVFNPLGVNNAILNTKSSSETMNKINDYFGYIRNKWWRKRQHKYSLNTTVYSGEGVWEWESTRQRWEGDSGNVLYPGLDGGCMGVDICKIH